MARAYNLEVSPAEYSMAGASVTAIVITYSETLLAKAQELITNGEFSIATVVAHMACEIAAERAISRAFAKKSIKDLEEPILAYVSGYNLANNRLRNLYNALTANEIQSQPFWRAFKDSAERRNQAVHKGRIITKAEAEDSYKAASDLVAYLSKNQP
jgi:ParB-like chromosome segregation protein Spo0J